MSKRILIVEDERDVATLLHHYLESKNYEVDEVYSGAEAMKRVFGGQYDLVLLDYAIRDIRGDRVCQLMRADKKMEKLPIIIVTGHIEVDDHIFKQYGATDVIYKPVDSDELYKKIEQHLGKSQ